MRKEVGRTQMAISNLITKVSSCEKLRDNFAFAVSKETYTYKTCKIQRPTSCLLTRAGHPQSTPGTPKQTGVWEAGNELKPQNMGLEWKLRKSSGQIAMQLPDWRKEPQRALSALLIDNESSTFKDWL